MTFEDYSEEIFPEHLNELATLLNETSIEYIPFSGSEILGLGLDMDAKPKDLTEFELNIQGSFITGKNANQKIILSPELLLSKPLVENTWFTYAETSAILNFLLDRLGAEALLNKIQVTLSDEFEYLSEGQAKAVIKRYLGFTLSSTERNDIYRLRKKIEGYQRLIDAFSDKIAVNRSRVDRYRDQNRHISLPTDNEFVETTRSRLAFMCWECKEYERFPTGKIINPPVHHDKPMTLNWTPSGTVRRPLKEITTSFKELESALTNPNHLRSITEAEKVKVAKIPEGFPKLYCDICNEYQDIENDLQQKLDFSDHRIDLPEHHGKEMQVVTYPVAEVEKVVQIAKKFSSLHDREPGLYFICKLCDLVIKAEPTPNNSEIADAIPPKHHDIGMGKLWIRDKIDK